MSVIIPCGNPLPSPKATITVTLLFTPNTNIYIFSPEKRLYAAVVIGLQPSFSSCGWLLTSWHHKLTPRNWIILARKNQLRRRVFCPKWDSFGLKIFAFQHANTHTHSHTFQGRASFWFMKRSTKSPKFHKVCCFLVVLDAQKQETSRRDGT